MTEQKIIPIFYDLLDEMNSDAQININVLEGIEKIAPLVGLQTIVNKFLGKLDELTKDKNYRVRMDTFKLLGFLGLRFGKADFMNMIFQTFM